MHDIFFLNLWRITLQILSYFNICKSPLPPPFAKWGISYTLIGEYSSLCQRQGRCTQPRYSFQADLQILLWWCAGDHWVRCDRPLLSIYQAAHPLSRATQPKGWLRFAVPLERHIHPCHLESEVRNIRQNHRQNNPFLAVVVSFWAMFWASWYPEIR